MPYLPSASYSYGMNAATPQAYGLQAALQARGPEINLPRTTSTYVSPNRAYGGGLPTGASQLSTLRGMSPEALLDLRTRYRIAEREPALNEQIREFDLSNTGQNERYYAGLGEQARQSDIDTQFNYDQLTTNALLSQLQDWSRMMSGIYSNLP